MLDEIRAGKIPVSTNRCGLQPSGINISRKSAHTWLHIWHIWEAHFLFPSVTAPSRWGRLLSAVVLSVFQPDGEIQVWDYVWLLTWTHLRQQTSFVLSLSPRFKAPYSQLSRSLEQRIAASIFKPPLSPHVPSAFFFFFFCIDADRN